MIIQRFAAFCDGNSGGNPAGVVIGDQLPPPSEMQEVAAQIGYSETVFAAPNIDGWRVRYFAPEMEVPFCGHATIALGAALARRLGSGTFKLTLNQMNISVKGINDSSRLSAMFESPHTRTETFSPELVDFALDLFCMSHDHLDSRIPPRIAIAGARHLVLMLKARLSLTSMKYDFSAGRDFMKANALTTILLGFAEAPKLFHCRNAFASGGIYEDPATGAATAALAGYLRELRWPHGGAIDLVQGEDMGCLSRIHAEIPKMLGGPVRVSGEVRPIAAGQLFNY
jgi:PhzF family phenazine biosynthesis protein